MPISPVCRRGPRSGRPSLSRKWGATSPCVESAVTAWEPQRFVVTERTTYGAGSLSRRIQLPHFPYEHFSLTLSCSWVRNCRLRVDPPSRKAAGLPVRSTTATIAPELSREKQPAHRPIDAKGGFLAVSRQGKENMNIGAKKWALMCPLRDIRGHSIFSVGSHQWAPTLQPFGRVTSLGRGYIALALAAHDVYALIPLFTVIIVLPNPPPDEESGPPALYPTSSLSRPDSGHIRWS